MGGISADDPAAIEKLQKKLDGLERSQLIMKEVNAYYRKHGKLDGCALLVPDQIEKLKASMASSWRSDPRPFESYQLTNLGGAFDMAVNYSEDNPYYRQEESENDDGTKDVLMYSMKQVSPEMVANIRNITGVKYCDASTENLYDGLLPIPGTVPVEEEFSHCVTGVGVWRSSEQEFFTSEKLTLIAGRHIAENDTHSAIISDVLAEKNQIKLGDTFTITGGSKKEISLEVIGLFHANVTEKLGAAVTSYDKIQNHIFTDIASAIEAENSAAVQGFDDVKVTVDDPENLKQIMEQVKHLPGYEENAYTIAADDEAYQSAAASISSLDALVKSLLIGIIVVSIIILALILTLWGKARVHETGVFLSLGIKKGNILGQYIAEVLLIAVFAFAASGITSNMFAATVADTLLQQTVQSNSLQDNAEDDTTMQSIDMSSALEDEETISPNIQISLGLEDLLRLYCIGFFIIVVSVTVSSVSVMRLKPRDILNRMS